MTIDERKDFAEESAIDYLANCFNANDSGIFGKAFEIGVKSFLNLNKGNSKHVSAKGKHDVTFHGMTLEIKSNCGEINDNIDTNNYIVYTMDNRHDCYQPYNARVLTIEQFKALFYGLGLVRTKTSTSGAVRTTIQSYKNSKKKSLALARALEQFETLEQFMSEH